MTRDQLAAAIKQALYDRVPGHAVMPAPGGGEWLAVGQIRLNVDVLCADMADDLIELFA